MEFLIVRNFEDRFNIIFITPDSHVRRVLCGLKPHFIAENGRYSIQNLFQISLSTFYTAPQFHITSFSQWLKHLYKVKDKYSVYCNRPIPETEWVLTRAKAVSLIPTHLNDKGLMCDRGGPEKVSLSAP